MNLNLFSKKVDLSNPFDLYPLVYRISVSPKLFASDKEFVKELSKLVGKRFENRITNIPLLLESSAKYQAVEELVKILQESSTEWRQMPRIGLFVVGDQFKKLFKEPKEFKSFTIDIDEGFSKDDMWWPLYCRTLNGFYRATRMQSETKTPIKGLPLKCPQCNSDIVEDVNNEDTQTEIDSSGCCEECGAIVVKLNEELLSKAYVYVRESEKKLGVTIFPTDV